MSDCTELGPAASTPGELRKSLSRDLIVTPLVFLVRGYMGGADRNLLLSFLVFSGEVLGLVYCWPTSP